MKQILYIIMLPWSMLFNLVFHQRLLKNPERGDYHQIGNGLEITLGIASGAIQTIIFLVGVIIYQWLH